MIIADEAFAGRLEALDAWIGGAYASVRLRERPDEETIVLPVGGGFAYFLGHAAPLTEAKGMGMSGPVEAGDILLLEKLFHDRGIAAKVMVCPLAHDSLVQELGRRGFRVAGFENVLVRELSKDDRDFAPVASAIAIGRAEDAGPGVVPDVFSRGFTAPAPPSREAVDYIEFSSQIPGMEVSLASLGGEPAGAASLLIRGSLAMLCGASTLPEFRSRGVQVTLTRSRLARAAEAGAEIVTVSSRPGGTTQRNVERMGFRVAFTRVALVKEAP